MKRVELFLIAVIVIAAFVICSLVLIEHRNDDIKNINKTHTAYRDSVNNVIFELKQDMNLLKAKRDTISVTNVIPNTITLKIKN